MIPTIPKRALLQIMFLSAAGVIFPKVQALAERQPPRSLVAYFSRTGNTRVIANQIRRARNATLFEINPATPYPEDYQATVAQAAAETESAYLPPLKQLVADIQSYEEVFLGFPIWGTTAPPVIRSFLLAHDLTGKPVVPFVPLTAVTDSAIASAWSKPTLQKPPSVVGSRSKQTRRNELWKLFPIGWTPCRQQTDCVAGAPGRWKTRTIISMERQF
ncbi:flavodoxin [Rhizobium leguminosarum]|uniref:flavodoxin n=1 Tax=Rhizobium leguminosarum TaxID=384 RepID=UPI001FDEE38F|nr:flavodoxin [Rhizobium leguminosarum]